MDKDNQHIKNTTIKIADFLLEFGFSLASPVLSIPYNGAKKIIEIAKDCHQHKTNERLYQFHCALLNGENTDGFIDKEFNIDDYTALLNSCLQDIEDEKAEIYGKFFKGLINNPELSKENRRTMILLIKELSMSDIQILKKIYIHSRFNINNNSGNIRDLINSKDHQMKMAKTKFSYHSLIDIDDHQIDEFAVLFIKTVFNTGELTPENIGLKEWRNIRVCIISYRLDDPSHFEIATKIESLLYDERISSVAIALVKSNKKTVYMMYSAGVLILNNQEIADEHIEIINEFSNKRPLFIVKTGNETNQCVNKIKHEKLFCLNSPYESDLKSFFSRVFEEYVIMENGRN
jgi:hypothetical protein